MAEQVATFKSKEVEKLLKQLIKNVKGFKEKDKEIIAMLDSVVLNDIDQHFRDQRGPNRSWPAWSPSYRAYMQRIGKGGNKILQFSGRLRQNLRPGESVRKTRDGLMWYNNAKTKDGFEYAAAHDEGGRKLPQRKFMWLSNKAIGKFEDQMIRWIER